MLSGSLYPGKSSAAAGYRFQRSSKASSRLTLYHAEAFGRWDVACRPLDGELDIRGRVAFSLHGGELIEVLIEMIPQWQLVNQLIKQVDERGLLLDRLRRPINSLRTHRRFVVCVAGGLRTLLHRLGPLWTP